MKTRIMLGALIMAALIGSSVGVGYAGSGDGGTGSGAGIQLLQCYGIANGAKPPPYVLNLDDQFTNATDERVGKLKLVCTPASVSATPDTLDSDPQNAGADHITCYEVSQAQATTSVVTLKDAFGEQTVAVLGSSRYICVLATKECHSGCPVLTPP
jgi:hypothetical protein